MPFCLHQSKNAQGRKEVPEAYTNTHSTHSTYVCLFSTFGHIDSVIKVSTVQIWTGGTGAAVYYDTQHLRVLLCVCLEEDTAH